MNSTLISLVSRSNEGINAPDIDLNSGILDLVPAPVWYVVGGFAALVIVAGLAYGGYLGGAALMFAKNNEAKVAEAIGTIKHSGMGALVVALTSVFILMIVGVVAQLS